MIHFAGVGTRIKNAVLRGKSEEKESECVPWMPALLRTALPPPRTTQPPRYIRSQVRVNPIRSSSVAGLEVRKLEKSRIRREMSTKDKEREKVPERA